jgi:hypothetical protein
MQRRPRHDQAFAAAFIACALLASRARAESNDTAALLLHTEAMGEDYLSTDFGAAEKKILKALAMCGGDACSRATRAKLQIDLGALAFAQSNIEGARAHFSAALQYVTTTVLDRDLATVEMQRVFDEAKASLPARKDPADRAVAPPSAVRSENAEECPPDFPGCREPHAAQAEESRQTCGSGNSCSGTAVCVKDACVEPKETAFSRNWLGLAFQQDVLALTSANDACAGGTGYTCFTNDGAYYADNPLRGADNTVSGGFAPATRRVMLSYDRVLGENFSVGTRIGFAFGGGPQRPTGVSFLPLHIEVRGAYWFGRTPHARLGLRPFVLAATGAAEVDASVKVSVYADAASYGRGAAQEVFAWKKTGFGFAALGAGAMLALTQNSGFTIEGRVMEMFPRPTTALGIQLGYVMGL